MTSKSKFDKVNHKVDNILRLRLKSTSCSVWLKNRQNNLTQTYKLYKL